MDRHCEELRRELHRLFDELGTDLRADLEKIAEEFNRRSDPGRTGAAPTAAPPSKLTANTAYQAAPLRSILSVL